MPIDAAKLLAFPIPAGRQVLTRRDVALYALSVGVGQDPLDPRILPFVDPAPDMTALPSMALVLAHPGFWLADPASGVVGADVLHADQSLELFAPIPTSGTVHSRSRIVSLVDKGPGRAALLRIRTTLDAGGGHCFARLERTVYVRGGGGFGGADEAATRPSRPEGEPTHVIDARTSRDQALLYRLNGDTNPLHSDPHVARKAGFERPILHGLCTAGIVGHALLKASNYDTASLRSIALRFTGPVLPGETIRTEIWSDGAFRARVVERDAVVVEDGRATRAAAASRQAAEGVAA